MMVTRSDDRGRRLSQAILTIVCLVVATGCGPVEPSEAPIAEGAPSALSFGPCGDCMEPAFGGAGPEPWHERLRSAAVIDTVNAELGRAQPMQGVDPIDGDGHIIGNDGGPVGMGPCADCLLVSVKLSDLGLPPEAIDDIEKAALIQRDGQGDDLLSIEETDPAWGYARPEGADPELWIGIPLDRMKRRAVWQVEEVQLTVRLEGGDEIETSAPPQQTRFQASDRAPDRPTP